LVTRLNTEEQIARFSWYPRQKKS